MIVVMVIGGITWSCEEQDLIPDTKSPNELDLQGITKLGQKLENPYSVSNMQKAWDNLQSSNGRISSGNKKVKTTHYYVKFIPKNEEELNILDRDSTLILYDHPLDYEIIEQGDFYRELGLPYDQPTPLYCAVTVDYEFPGQVETEILEDLFIPDDKSDKNGRTSNSGISDADVDILVYEALKITNNLTNYDNNKEVNSGRASSWRPAGTIKVWDDNIGMTTVSRQEFWYWEYYECDENDPQIINRISLEPLCKRAVYRTVYDEIDGSSVGLGGVEVRARRWFTTYEGITNSQGVYSCDGTFKRDANYSIVWERYNFKIRRDALNGAKLDGPDKTGDWNVNIKGGKQEFYSIIFRAAYHYYYGSIKGLRRPPKNGTFKTQLKIRAVYEENNDSYGNHSSGRRFLGLGSAIKIWNPQRSSLGLYATTIHELAHASHWEMDQSNYNKMNDCDDTFIGLYCSGDTKVAESWARGVQWELTIMRYTSYLGGDTNRPDYTQVVVDMIDGSTDNNAGSENLLQDNVSGYTIRQIEDALNGQKTWNGWRNNIINRYNNGTENNLDELFAHWD